jgi:cytidylate kinase
MARDKGVVMDGRDIGTVVFPDADIKIYLTAKPEIRAQRRYDELMGKGMEASYREIYENIMDRDHQDSTREISPLKKAEDAIELDNSSMTPEEQMAWFRELLKKKFGDIK